MTVPRWVQDFTRPQAPPLVPELRLYLADQLTPLWQATEADLQQKNLEPPYWAFAWPGGQGLARFILDRPELVRGLAVLDLAAGSGLAALAAIRAGARAVLALDRDPAVATVVAMNAGLNDLPPPELVIADALREPWPAVDVILAGDIFYERAAADSYGPLLAQQAARGVLVLVGDPGRAFLPRPQLRPLAHYTVPTTLELEDAPHRITDIYAWRV